MDPIHTWLDPVAVRQLADQLLQPNRESSLSPSNDGFDDGFIGFDAEPSSPDAEPSFFAESQPVTVATPAEKMECFSRWLQQNHGAGGVFILDQEGAVIFGEGGHEYLHFLARSVAVAPRRAEAGHVHVKISAGEVLQMIRCESLVLGAVTPEALTPASVMEIAGEFSALAATR